MDPVVFRVALDGTIAEDFVVIQAEVPELNAERVVTWSVSFVVAG